MKTSKEMQVKILERVIDNIKKGEHNRRDIEVYCNEKGAWVDVITGTLNAVWFDFNFEYRIKPETITINGVKIPKPLSREEVAELSWGTYVYFIASNDDLFAYKERQFVERKDFNRVMCFLTPEEAVEASKLLFGIKE